MTFFMKDLETLGTVPGCSMLSIGLIAFDPFAETVDDLFLDQGFYCVVNREDSKQNFLHEDPGTIAWWSKQSEAARKVLADAANKKTSIPLRLAVESTIDYVSGHCSPREARMLGNGADFDNPIFTVAAHMVQIKVPWSYGGRCYRTLKNLDEFLGPKFRAPKMQRTGTYHNALDDAKSQVMHLWETLDKFRRLVA